MLGYITAIAGTVMCIGYYVYCFIKHENPFFYYEENDDDGD